MKELFTKVLEALAVGDARGMPTEFMTRNAIKEKFGYVDRLLDPSLSKIHTDLQPYTVTDDTEQNLYLIEQYCIDGYVSVKNTTETLLRWIKETDAKGKGYIGPSSLKALQGIERGEDPHSAGKEGVTCGAPMRVLAPVLCTTRKNLVDAVYQCCIPTHNTNLAIEAAMSLSFAMHTALVGGDRNAIIESSLEGAVIGSGMSEYVHVGPSTGKRIEALLPRIAKITKIDDLLDFLYNVNGTGLGANEVVPSVIAIFSFTAEDVWSAICAGSSIGGDTDTIAALSGALSALFRKDHNIPSGILDKIMAANRLPIERCSSLLKRKWGTVQT